MNHAQIALVVTEPVLFKVFYARRDGARGVLASTHPAALAVHSGIVADTPRADGSRGVAMASIFLTLALTN